jgi:hypothetical protein
MRLFVAIITLLVSRLALAEYENSKILECHVTNSQFNSVLSLDTVGVGYLKFKKSGNETIYTCGLRLNHLSDGHKSVNPNVRVEFQRGSCEPKLGADLKKLLLNRITVIIDILPKSRYDGIAQWLATPQPDDCKVEKLSLEDIERYAQQFSVGKWGKKKAGDPKKAPASIKVK